MKKRQVVVRREVISYNTSNSNRNNNNTTTTNNIVQYGECLKNHAANSGGYAVDGCREFMASSVSGGEGTSAALTCAACGCHRNFHRRQVNSIASSGV